MSRKPNTTDAMRQLIQEVKTALPLDLTPIDVCSDECKNCSIKLVEYIATELENWEYKLDAGDTPDFKDLSRLAKSSQKIYRALVKNGLVKDLS